MARNRITTIIGPNGAGKSTLFNLISGAIRPRSGGHVLIEGIDHTAQPPYRMQAAGLARSFQITNLFFNLSVAENLRLASQILNLAHGCGGRFPQQQGDWRESTNCWSGSRLTGKADYQAGELARRATPPRSRRCPRLQTQSAAARRTDAGHEPWRHTGHGRAHPSLTSDVTVLLIEHDIGLVASLSDHVIVMHQGQKLAEGAPPTCATIRPCRPPISGHA